MSQYRNSDVISMHVAQFDRAVCTRVDPGIMVPVSEEAGTRIQKGLCVACIHKSECLELAISFDADGIWGGTDKRERKEIVRVRTLDGDAIRRLDDETKLVVSRPRRSKVRA